jgi:hypothetical protein
LNESFLKGHKFKLDTISSYNDELVYVVKILPALGSKEYYEFGRRLIIPVGKLFIRTHDFAILKMEYNYILNPKKRKTFDFQLINELFGSRIIFQVIAIYKEYQGQIYLSYLSSKEYFSISNKDRERRKNNGRVYDLIERELLVNEIITDSTMVRDIESTYTWDNNIFDRSSVEYDKTFWDNYNLIPRTEQQEKRLRTDLEGNISLDAQFGKEE